jgi:CO/xanthine dehydrogenase FAD-binding subunit
MHSNPSQYDLIAPSTLEAVLDILASEPGHYTPIAGGTEIMVALGAGRLARKPLLSINHLEELRFIEVSGSEIAIGSGTTFTDIRRDAVIASDFPLLSLAASWTGSIANQNRGTIGGNIVNGSPAADSPPALLVYDAVLTLISTRGTRLMPYGDFHLGYKKTALAPDELVHSITLQRDFQDYVPYTRKVGTRNAQAISKVAIAALARRNNEVLDDVRIGAASLRDRPTRLPETEAVLRNQPLTPDTIGPLLVKARAALLAETLPIDDIRSTARYRSAVAGNLLEEFLRSL